MTRHDLASGLVVARVGTDDDLTGWLRSASLAACEQIAAATAMLVLAPTAPKGLLGLWLATLQRANQVADAFITVFWSRHTWPDKEWVNLKSALKPAIVADGNTGWFNWFAQIEPEYAAEALALRN